jgi:formylglycine-generating enzyme required for sulfatase activity
MKQFLIILFSLATIVNVFGGANDYDTKVLGIEWAKIPAGEFKMGSNKGKINEKPVHTVYIDTYYLSKHVVTFAQYDVFCEDTRRKKPDDSGWDRGNRPVINVDWHDAATFCQWLSKKTGKNIHLPTEAQWEKACRAGSSEERYGDINKIAWYDKNSGKKTHPVGKKQANKYGLYDMLGNVYELCSDWYSNKYYSNSPSKNPSGPSSGSFRVTRGGSWLSNDRAVRAANRRYSPSSFRYYDLGFRLAMD